MGGTTGGPTLPQSGSTSGGETPDVHDFPRGGVTLPAAGSGLPGMGGTDGFGGFGRSYLTDSVGPGGANLPDDVETASSFLAHNGFMVGPTREPSEHFMNGIEALRGHLDTLTGGGAPSGGQVKPEGTLELLTQRAVSAGHLTAPESLAAPKAVAAAAVYKPMPSLLAPPAPAAVRGATLGSVGKIMSAATSGVPKGAAAGPPTVPETAPVKGAVFGDNERGTLLDLARGGEQRSVKYVVNRIQDALAKDQTTLDRLDPELRTFYTAYQTHLRTQPYTTDPNALALQEHNALIAAHEAIGSEHLGPAFVQGAAGTVANVVEGAGHLAGSDRLIDAGRSLRAKIKAAFPVPDSVTDTGSVQTGLGYGRLAPAGALAGAGAVGGTALRVGGTLLAGADSAGDSAQALARQGASRADQRIGAFVSAVSEALGPAGTKLAAKEVAKLTKTHLGLDLADLARPELEALNGMLAPTGVQVMLDGAVQSLRNRARAKPDRQR